MQAHCFLIKPLLLLLLILIPALSFDFNKYSHHQLNQGWAEFLGDEITTYFDIPLEFDGTNSVPKWLKGSYVKNGPARKQFGKDRTYSNLMDSWGKLHRFTFNDGKVTFTGRMIETGNYNKSVKAEKMVPTITLKPTLPEDWTILELFNVFQNLYDNTNVMLWKLGPEDSSVGQYLAVTDYPKVNLIDPKTLAVKDLLTIDPSEGTSMASCAHWRREVGKNTSLNFHVMYDFFSGNNNFVLYRFGNSIDDFEVVGKFPMPRQSVIHMFSITENYAIIPIYPVTMDISKMFTHNMHPFEGMTKQDAPTEFYLINLNDGSVTGGFKTSEPALIISTHHANAWEEDDEVVFDLTCGLPWDIFSTAMDLDQMLSEDATGQENTGVMKRLRLNLVTKEVTVQDWPNAQKIPLLNKLDFPVINNNYVGLKNRYTYGWVSFDYWRITLVKKDLEDSMKDKTWHEDSHYPGEPFFVPRPGATKEDDGVVITIVFDGSKKQSYLLLLDGETFREMARSYLPHTVPFSFHGNWFPELH